MQPHKGAVMELAAYTFETLRRDGEFIVYRGHHRRHTDARPPSLLALTPVLERPALASLRRMEHEYAFQAELDPGWAVRPLALASYEGRTMLVLTDPGGEPLERLLGQPMALPPFLRLATKNTHHTVREVGLQHTIAILMRDYVRGQREGQMTLSFQGYDEVAGRSVYHLTLVCHADKTAGYYAQRGEIWVDTEHFLPIRLTLYDWDSELYAHYEYQRLA